MRVLALLWLCININEEDIRGKSVLEVGAQDVNGSIREFILKYKPKSYIGVDIQQGKGVDMVLDAKDLIKTFGEESFDVVISTEMLEHVDDWRAVIHNLKGVVKKGGLLILTTVSQGFPYHAYPYDFWRYEIDDFKQIFEDFDILKLDKDEEHGVLLKARKPLNYNENNLENIALYSMLTGKRELNKPKHFKLKIKVKIYLSRVINYVCSIVCRVPYLLFSFFNANKKHQC